MNMVSQLENDDIVILPYLVGKYIQSISLFQENLFADCIFPFAQQKTDSSCILSSGFSPIDFKDVFGEGPVDPINGGDQQKTGHRISAHASGDRYDVDLRDTGCLGLAVFKQKSESSAALYASVLSGAGNRLLVSRDGKSFERIPSPLGGAVVRSIAALNDCLFSTAVDEKLGAVLFVSDDPVKGDWRQAADAGFGDAENLAITSLAEFNGHLYAGTLNPYSGFQVWCTTADGEAPYPWHQIIGRGALRYVSNMAAVSMTEFAGALYVGTGSPRGCDALDDTGTEAAELIRIYPDNSWDIVVGSPRFSPDGLKVPMAAVGPGFDDRANIAIGPMVVHRGRLYAGTYRAKNYEPETGQCGYRLWSTADGDDWCAFSIDIPESGRASGITAMVSIKDNLMLAASDLGKACPVSILESGRAADRPASAASRTRIVGLFER